MRKQIAGIGLTFSLAGIVSSPTTILADRQDALAVASVKTVPLVLIKRDWKQPPMLVIQTTPRPTPPPRPRHLPHKSR